MLAGLFDAAAAGVLGASGVRQCGAVGDNAVVIGMAAMGLPTAQRLRALWLGIALVTVLRIGFAVIATTLPQVIGLLLAGGALLPWVGCKLWREIRSATDATSETDSGAAEGKAAGRALWQIVVADVSMSLDNVLAVTGAAIDDPAVPSTYRHPIPDMAKLVRATYASKCRDRWPGQAGPLSIGGRESASTRAGIIAWLAPRRRSAGKRSSHRDSRPRGTTGTHPRGRLSRTRRIS